MSLSQTLTETIDEVIQRFIERVSTKYNLDNKELKRLWGGDVLKSNKTEKKSSPQKESTISADIDYDVLLKCNKTELTAMCKSRGHKCSGTKTILINRLLGKECSSPKEKSPKEKSNKPKETRHVPVKETPVHKKLVANIPNILIRRNQFNNYEHPETGLIFDNNNKIVIGKQNEDGSIDPLTENDIDQCNAFKFKFRIPIDLDSKSSLVDVKVDELSEDEEEEEEEELEVEEEEELEVEEEELEVEEELEEEDLLDEDEDEDFEEYESD